MLKILLLVGVFTSRILIAQKNINKQENLLIFH